MNIKAFFGDALAQALVGGIGTPDDVLRHITPDVLAAHLPRPLWARLLTACLGAPKLDAQLIIETIGIANLCEHVPTTIVWACIAEMGTRSLGSAYVAPPIMTRASLSPPSAALAPAAPAARVQRPQPSVLSPPPAAIERVPAATPAAAANRPALPPVNQPVADVITELEADEKPVTRSRTTTAQRFRQSTTGIGRIGGSRQERRPMVPAATPPPVTTTPTKPRRSGTEIEESETDSEWKSREIAVDDSQLVEWQSADTTQASENDDFGDIGRKS